LNRLPGVAAVGLVLGFVLFFARWNTGQRVTLDLGFWTLYRVPVTWVAFGSLLLGMAVMLLAGLHADLRVRKFLRDRLAAENDARDARLEVDRLQQDLFQAPPPAARAAPPEDSAPPDDPGPAPPP
jgi:uncharacterized integral membrane protein